MNRTREIVLLYAREKTWRTLVLVFMAGILLTLLPGIAPEIFKSLPARSALGSVMTMAGVWLTFLLGLMLKRQLANHRASLLPGYRDPHVVIFLVIYSAFALMGVMWTVYVGHQFHAGFEDKLAVIVAGIFVSVVCVVLGYLSVGILTAAAFIVFCLFSDPVYMAYGERLGFMETNILTLFLSVIILLILAQRLLNVREGHWEYSYLLSWTRPSYVTDLRGNGLMWGRMLGSLRTLFGDRVRVMPAVSYHQLSGSLTRAMHWERAKYEFYRIAFVGLILLIPFYVVYINLVPGHFISFLNGHLKYFILAVYPVILAVGLNQRSIAQWGYDLTKPVRRDKFIQEKGTVVLIDVFLYWLAAVVFVMVLPYAILDPAQLSQGKFWADIVMTLAYASTVFGWIACLRDVPAGFTVVGLSILTVLTACQLFALPVLSMGYVMAAAAVWLCVGVMLLRCAYHKWCDAEF